MELSHPVGPGAITEFDQMFEIGCKAIVRSLVLASRSWRLPKRAAARGRRDAELIDFLEQTIEALLRCWLVHSRGVRLSVLETVSQKRPLAGTEAIHRALRPRPVHAAIHEPGEPAGDPAPGRRRLAASAAGRARRRRAVPPAGRAGRAAAARRGRPLAHLALEAVVENYAEYIDYNSTTTQSDRGEMLYTLLDYLRLRASYDRVAWNLQPVVLAHEVLVRGGRDAAAESLAQRRGRADRRHRRGTPASGSPGSTASTACGCRASPSGWGSGSCGRCRWIGLCAWCGRPSRSCDRQSGAGVGGVPTAVGSDAGGRRGAGRFSPAGRGDRRVHPRNSGAGFDLPAWLEALQQEVDRVQSQAAEDEEMPGPELPIPQVLLSREEVRRQVRAIHGG